MVYAAPLVSGRPAAALARSHSLLPWLLLLPAVLALGLAVWAGYGVGWAGLGVSLGGLCLLLGQWGRWSLSARVGASLPLAILGHGLTLAGGSWLETDALLLLAVAGNTESATTPVSALPSSAGEQFPHAPPPAPRASPEQLLLAAGSVRGTPDLLFVAHVGELLSLDAASERSGRGVVFTTTATGALQQFSYPEFRWQASYQLEQPAYRVLVDGRRGLLWAAASEPRALRVSGVGERSSGRGDLHLYDIHQAQLGRLETHAHLQPRRVLSLQGDVMELLATADRSRLFYLAQTDRGVHLGRIDADAESVDRRLPLPAEICALCLTPDGATLFAAGAGLLLVIDAATLRLVRRLEMDADFSAVAADNEQQVYLGEQGPWTDLTKLDLSVPNARGRKWPAHLYGRIFLKLAPDGHRLYVGTSSVISNHLDALLVRGSLGPIPPQCGMVSSDANGPVRGEFFLTPDGQFLVNRWGKVFRLLQGKTAPPNRRTDLASLPK